MKRIKHSLPYMESFVGRKSLYSSLVNDKESVDHTLLEDIEISIQEWRKKCTILLLNRHMEEYHLHCNQVHSHLHSHLHSISYKLTLLI